jgi:hypothetical protein
MCIPSLIGILTLKFFVSSVNGLYIYKYVYIYIYIFVFEFYEIVCHVCSVGDGMCVQEVKHFVKRFAEEFWIVYKLAN